ENIPVVEEIPVMEEVMMAPVVEDAVVAPSKDAPKMDEMNIQEQNMEQKAPLDETATITPGLTVKGDLMAEGSLDIAGSVEGNVHCRGKLVLTGSIFGDVTAAEIFANNAHITGNVSCSGSVKIGSGSVIIGNIEGTSAVVAGAVKGLIDVHGPVIVDGTAIVMGDIKSKSVQINIGAAIDGRCSQVYADVSPTAFFKEN
nr:polymer-forming cytoskeletal protein [Lachnospiraceae bacterium]